MLVLSERAGVSRIEFWKRAGGYRVDYWAGNSECANRVGAAISVAVNSQAFATGRAIGDGGGPVIRVDIALP